MFNFTVFVTEITTAFSAGSRESRSECAAVETHVADSCCFSVSSQHDPPLLYSHDPPLLRWHFESNGGDIGFGVFMKNKMGERKRAGEMRGVVRSERYNAHLVPEENSLTCVDPGVCE